VGAGSVDAVGGTGTGGPSSQTPEPEQPTSQLFPTDSLLSSQTQKKTN
jgi:hypothetical protein